MANMNTSEDLLQCPITKELFRDPVLSPDGHTYERQAIERWVRDHGTSPLTRQPLSIEQLYPNRKVKELVDVFEELLHRRKYRFVLDADVKKKKGRPIFQTTGKTIFGAEWVVDNDKRPKIVILKLDGARASKEASFYVDLSRHPHIIRTFGFVHDANNPDQSNSILLVQEYAPEGNLYELLQDRRTAPDEKILIQIFLQITEAMIYLASKHVVHGDLACRNVLVFRFDEKEPESSVVKIADFGLSRHSQLYSMTSAAARTRSNIAPTRYAAPEVLLSNDTLEVYTEKSDVYSMGVLMWEAYSRGSLPWADIENDNDVIRRVRNGDLLPQPSNCSQPFWSIITKTWSTLPSNRPTFKELKHLTKQYYHPEEQPSTSSKKIPEFSQKQLACGGRACYECGKCRDWHFEGPPDYWHKIHDWENWTTDDWLVFRFDDWKRCWHRRFDATCSSNLGYGAHEFISREANGTEVASACRLYPAHFPSDTKRLRLPNGFANLICVCDS